MGFYEFMGVILVLGMILILLRGLVNHCRAEKWKYIQTQSMATDCSLAPEEEGV